MKKSLISMICFTLLVSFFCSTSQVHAVNFEGQEDKYMKLCSSKSLSNSNYNTCEQFNSYLKKKNNQLQSSIDESKSKISDTQSSLDSFLSSVVVTQSQYTLQTQYEDLLAKQQKDLASAESEQSKISDTQSSLDSFLSSVVVTQSSSSGSSSSGSTTIRPSTNVPTTNKYGSTVVAAAYSKLGCPYVWGASGPNSFDCSGLVMWCYAQAGVSLDHYSGSQGQSGAIIPLSQAQPGDILWKSGHVGIYIGNGQYIHAPQTGDVVKIASNVSRFTCAVRPY